MQVRTRPVKDHAYPCFIRLRPRVSFLLHHALVKLSDFWNLDLNNFTSSTMTAVAAKPDGRAVLAKLMAQGVVPIFQRFAELNARCLIEMHRN